jgi:hypothetical protein
METSHNYLIVSDFHVGEGRCPETGLFYCSEDFFHDFPFAQFLAYHAACQVSELMAGEPGIDRPHLKKPWKLVINGDLFDFMEVSAPASGDTSWVDPNHTTLSANEKRFGLGTRSQETIWKLKRIADGHALLFEAMAWFLGHPGYELVLLRGNHDVELYWPEVRQEFLGQLAIAYDRWQSSIGGGCLETSPLVLHPDMLPELSASVLDSVVSFPPTFVYEKDLLYIEHGGQHDHTTFFPDFEDPRLPEPKSDRIQLPSGSLFVRYWFNRAERIHPFAENIKPVSHYPLWLITKLPPRAERILLYLVQGCLWVQIKRFEDWLRRPWFWQPGPIQDRDQEGCSRPPMSEGFCAELPMIQKRSRRLLKRASFWATLCVLFSVVVRLAAFVAALLSVREFFIRDYDPAVLYLLAAVVLWVVSRVVGRRSARVWNTRQLLKAADWINRYLAGEQAEHPERPGPVPFYIFGHNHRPWLKRLQSASSGSKPAWYINTGSWLPEFSEDDPFKERYELMFLRLVPGRPGFDDELPELLEWLPNANRPRPCRLFDERAFH